MALPPDDFFLDTSNLVRLSCFTSRTNVTHTGGTMQLSPVEIKIRILKNGDSIAGLARQWGTSREILSRVVHRSPGTAYPELRKRLADYLNVPITKVGREASTSPKSRYTRQAQAV